MLHYLWVTAPFPEFESNMIRGTVILIHYNRAVVLDFPSSVTGKADCELRLEIKLQCIIWE